MNNAYVLSMRERIAQIKSELEGLANISAQRSLSQYEYRAAERALQILIEACIGIAKHWSYATSKTIAADAYSAFEKLEQQGIDVVTEVEWKKVIGMRNALVHDYLNIEASVIKTVIKTSKFKVMFGFVDEGLKQLEQMYGE